MHVSALLLLFIASAILNLSLAIYGWRQRHLPGAIAFSLAMFLFAFLPISQTVNIFSSDITTKVIALKSRVEMAGIGATAWLVMVMQFSGYAHLMNRRLLIALSIVPLVTLILNWTENPLFRSGYYIVLIGSVPALRWTNGPVFWVGLLYLNAVLLTPIYLLWRSYGRISPLSFRQTLALSISTILPLIINALSQVGFPPVQGINFPFAAGPAMGLIVAWAVLRYHIFDLIPIARGLLIESMNDGVLVLDTQNRIVDINPAMQELIGPATLGQSAESAFAIWPDLITRFRGITEARTEIAIEGNPPEYFDLRISSLIDRRGKLTGRLIVVRDITRHKQIENALHASENNFRRMLESAPDAMLIVNQEGSITLANIQCEKIFGYPQTELIGQSVEILLPERFREIHKTHRAEYYQNPQARPMGVDVKWELLAHRKDGNIFPVEISLSPLDTDTGLFTMAAIRDTTERKQLEAQLRLQATALEATVNAIVITDFKGVIQWVNPAFTQLTGYSFVESIDQTPKLIRSGRHNVTFYENLWNTINSGSVWEGEIINRRKDGSEYFEHQTITPVRDERGEISHFISMKQDITQRKQAEQALREAELKYRTLVEQMPVVLYIDGLDEVSANAFVSPQIEALLGYPFVRWEQDPSFWKKCVHPEDYDRAIAVTPNTLTQERVTEEYRMIAQDGRVIWVRDHSILARDRTGQPQFVQGFWEDITERKQAEEALRRQNDYLEALHQISLDLLNRRDVDDLLNAIIHNATRLLDAPYGDLDIVEGDVMIAWAYTENQSFEKALRTRRGEAGAASWQAYDTRQPVIINDYSGWPQRNPVFEGLPIHATIIVPLISGDHCLGVFSLSRSEVGRPFTSDEVQLTSLFAQQAALALDNTRLHASSLHEIEERKRTEETLRSQNDYLAALHQVTLGLIDRLDTDSLLEAMLAHFVVLMKTRHAFIELLDLKENVLIQKVAVGNYTSQNGFRTARGTGLTGRVWESGEMLIIPNYPAWEGALPEFQWLRTVAGIPLKIGGKVIGVIGVAFDEPDRIFTSEEIDLLQRFANLASVALDNAQLFTGVMRQSKELRLLHEVRTAIAGELDMNRIVHRTVEAVVETFGYTLVSLYLREGNLLILQHQVGYDQVIPTIPITSGVSGRVVRTGKPVFLEDVHNDPSFLGAQEGIVSEVAVPIMDDGRVAGILNIESRYGVKLAEADLRLMIALSEQIGIALSRARLYESLTRNNERLSQLHQITLDLLKERNMEDLLQAIVDQGSKLLATDIGYLALKEGDLLVDRAFSPNDAHYQKMAVERDKDKSPVWKVLDSREPFITADYSSIPNLRPQTVALGIKAGMLLPLLTTETCQGVLGTGRLQPNNPFSDEDIRLGGLFARVAGLTIDNAQLHEMLRQESIRDPLTGLFNRRFMEEALAKELNRADRTTRPLAVVMLDLDHFKSINDTFGHDGGDKALRRLSLLLKASIRGSDIICRYGGEEFTLILPDASLTDALLRMEQLRKDIKQLAIQHQGKSMNRFTGSFGIAVFPEHGSTGETLLKAADEALYRAKQSGRDQVLTA
jgi:diguanylate cyclase (GGDEF)-like protein/PAS domain S-box-containing protein